MKMRSSVVTCGLLAAVFAGQNADAAITFSGAGGTANMDLTITQDIVIPLSVIPTSRIFVFSLAGVYAPSQYPLLSLNYPATAYATGIHGDISKSGGGTTAAVQYETWGGLGIDLGVIGEGDFLGQFDFVTVPSAAVGDSFVIRAGTLHFNGHPNPGVGVLAPVFTPTTIQLFDDQFRALSAPQPIIVPEPAAMLTAGAIPLALLRRHRS